MPRPRKTTAALLAAGSFDKNPARAKDRSDVGKAGPLLVPPVNLPDDEKEAFSEIIMSAEPGVLKQNHFLHVRSAARLLAKENAGTITTQERAQLFKAYEQLGMTPRSQSYVSAPKGEVANEFSNI